jgi:hypothetical protein
MRYFYLFFAFVLLCVAGCGSSSAVITGTVKFDDGTPADFGAVVFQNEHSNFTAKINSDGTYQTTGDIYNGLPAGSYQVFIGGSQIKPSSQVPGQRPVVTYRCAKKYSSAATSGLTFEVKPGGPKTFDITVERP